MKRTAKVSGILLGAAILATSCPVAAMERGTRENPIYYKEAKEEKEFNLSAHSGLIFGAILPVVAGWALLYTRKSEKDFQSRFSAQKAKQVSKFFTKDYMQNLWYFIYDELVGQRKQSSALKTKEDKKIYTSEETPAYGVLGTIDSYASPLAESAKKFTEPFVSVMALYIVLKEFAVKAEDRAKKAFKCEEAPTVVVAPVDQPADAGVPL